MNNPLDREKGASGQTVLSQPFIVCRLLSGVCRHGSGQLHKFIL